MAHLGVLQKKKQQPFLSVPITASSPYPDPHSTKYWAIQICHFCFALLH